MSRWLGLPGYAGLGLLLAGCGGQQSILGASSPAASHIESLWWISLASTGVLSTLVFLALGYAVIQARRAAMEERAEDADHGGEGRVILIVGALIPTVFLVGFLTLAVRTGSVVSAPDETPERTIEVIGHMFWWEIRYPDAGVVTANELRIPVGEPVAIHVSSADVIHSFWVPQLGPGKIDMVPGRTNVTWLLADEPGEYRGQCTEFCGVQHALMSLLVIASPPEEFEAWLERRTDPPPVPTDVERRRGLFLFSDRGCDACHAIADVAPAEGMGMAGPNLDDLASRRTLGALRVENTPENLAQWIANPHDFKPGVRMPATELEDEDLEALVSYLRGLEP
jgi:cytochrome c oxidase subunit II